MGKIILAGVLALALAPAFVSGETKAQKLARQARRLESNLETVLNNLQEGVGSSCPGTSEYSDDIGALNARRRREFKRVGLPPPACDYPTCGDGETYGGYCGGS